MEARVAVVVASNNSEKFILYGGKDSVCVTDGQKVWRKLIHENDTENIFAATSTIEKDGEDANVKLLIGTDKQTTVCTFQRLSAAEQSAELSGMVFSLSEHVLELKKRLKRAEERCAQNSQASSNVSLTDLELHKKGSSPVNVVRRKKGMSILHPSVKRFKGPQKVEYE